MGNWVGYAPAPEPQRARFTFGGKEYDLKVSSDELFDYLQEVTTGNKAACAKRLSDMLVSDNSRLLLLVVTGSCGAAPRRVDRARICRTADSLFVTSLARDKAIVVARAAGNDGALIINTKEAASNTSWTICSIVSGCP